MWSFSLDSWDVVNGTLIPEVPALILTGALKQSPSMKMEHGEHLFSTISLAQAL
jgi:hypothetical protein